MTLQDPYVEDFLNEWQGEVTLRSNAVTVLRGTNLSTDGQNTHDDYDPAAVAAADACGCHIPRLHAGK